MSGSPSPLAREALLEQLRAAGGRPLSLPEILQRARIHPGRLREAKRLARSMAQEGVIRAVGRRFSLPEPARGAIAGEPPRRARATSPSLLGLYTRHRDGFGFLARLDRAGPDLFVAPGDGGQAVDGDVVRYEVFPGRRGEQARIVEVVDRGRRMLLGRLAARGPESVVVPTDAELPPRVPVVAERAFRDGDLVKVWIDPGPGLLSGRVLERVAHPGTPGVEVLRVGYAHGFADVFPAEVVAEAEEVPDRVRPQDWEGRRDLTRMPLVTIDGEDARDFDDAVYVEPLPRGGGHRLVVAIADVSHYVQPGRPLDAEAVRRGTSVYFPGTVLPMLPERLSNGVCSLNPEVERLCMVADMRFDAEGRPGETEVYPAVMRSAARCTYGEVARMLDGDRVAHLEFLRPNFERMAELQARLGTERRRRGSIDFDLPESRVVLGDDGNVLAIERRPRNRAHRIVEEFMLAANEAVARWFGERDLPTIYRVHGVPDEDKLGAFLDLARSQGLEVPAVDTGPLALADLLDRLAGHPQQRALNQLLLRAMMQAVYSPQNIGHYGLAASQYLHFTSPIRRYPDLVVHRLLREAAGWREGRPPRPVRPGELERIAFLASERERSAMKAERDVNAYFTALHLQDKVGERSRGTVAAVVEFGLFVEMHRWYAEGLVRAEDLGDDFQLDEAGHALVDRRSGRAYRVGDELEVEIGSVDTVLRRVDLLVVEAGETRLRGQRPGPRSGKRPSRRDGDGKGKGKGKRSGDAGRPGPGKKGKRGAGGPDRGASPRGRAGGKKGRKRR